MEKKKRKIKKGKKFYIFLLTAFILAIFCFIAGLFLFAQKDKASIYTFPENPKQGDTVFIKVKTKASQITGNCGTEKLFFYKKEGMPEWVAFLGIDADKKPGDYQIFADTSDAEHLQKNIKISLADFSLAPVIASPKNNQGGISTEKAIDNIVKNDNPSLKKVLSVSNPNPYFKGQFLFPLDNVKKSGFGFGQFIGFGKYKVQHFGVDLKAPEYTEIFAVNDGKVVATLNLENYGKTAVIDHGLNIFSLYLHLEEFKVSEGDMVRRGQLIGLSGETGYATAPHLHFSMRVDGSRIDPLVFINTTSKLEDNSFLASISEAFMKFFKK